MATDYILFVHGVNTRTKPESPDYAKELIAKIHQSNQDLKASLNFEMVPLYWGDVMTDAEEQLRTWFKESPIYKNFWFKDFRDNQLLRFAGDAALYISRYIGSDVVEQLKTQAILGLKDFQPEDRLHLVTHSWGTVILFDIFFAGRWDNEDIPGHKSAEVIRNQLFGIEPLPNTGIRIASIHTMGSPIAIANLINLKREKMEPGQELTDIKIETTFTHDITLRLEKLLKTLYATRNTKLPWRNFAHPGDPIANPLATVIPKLLDSRQEYLDIQDVLVNGSGPLEWLAKPMSGTFLSLINGGSAHSSYWQSKQVAQTITQTIQQTAKKG